MDMGYGTENVPHPFKMFSNWFSDASFSTTLPFRLSERIVTEHGSEEHTLQPRAAFQDKKNLTPFATDANLHENSVKQQ